MFNRLAILLADVPLNAYTVTAFSAFASFFVWRIWKFTVRPFFYPNDPVELPYWVPFFGHSFSFFGNSDRLLERGLDYTGRTHEVYAIQTLYKKLYIITDPNDVTAALKDKTALHFDGHLNELLANFGFSGEALRLAWHVPEPGDWCYLPGNTTNPDLISLNRLTEDVYRRQLLPGEKMDVMCKVFLRSLLNTVQWHNMEMCTYQTNRHRNYIVAI